MNQAVDLPRTVREIADRRGVFRPEAYFFVLEALENAMENTPDTGHISGGDLLDWIRRLGQGRFGAMAGVVFNHWGVNATLDFGRIVFHLVEEGLLKKREEDSLIDFLDKFDFGEAFTLRSFEAEG